MKVMGSAVETSGTYANTCISGFGHLDSMCIIFQMHAELYIYMISYAWFIYTYVCVCVVVFLNI